VAATQMIKARPLTGFGQGGFVANYRDYAVSLFTTYVSRNFEHSTVHNYFLFLLTEQGIPGFLLFLVFIVFIYIRGQKIYIETQDPEEKKIVLAVLVALVVMLFDNMLSDLIEDVKIGPIFYWLIALLVMQDRKNEKLKIKN
jgi:O-antigen ligase